MTVTYSGDAANTFIINTNRGTIAIEMDRVNAPNHVERLETLARNGEYDNVAWHRLNDFVAQAGDVQFGDLANYDPDNVGIGGSSLPDLALENGVSSYARGDVGMARSSDPDSANSQFFIITTDVPLNGEFSRFGSVLDGMQFVDQLTSTTTRVQIDANTSIPVEVPDRMINVFVADDLAPGRTSVGTAGLDNLVGGDEDEAFFGLSGGDTVEAGGGADVIATHSGADSIEAGAGNDTVDAGKGNDVVNGDTGNDDISGGLNADTLSGGAGDDTIDGGNGHDLISGGADNDMVMAGTGNDTVNGGAGNDTLFGNRKRDLIDGGVGDDLIAGGNGVDTITGGLGDDTMSGGLGADTFVYVQEAFGTDEISDFALGVDRIDLTALALGEGELNLLERDGNTEVSVGTAGGTILLVGTTGITVENSADVFLL